MKTAKLFTNGRSQAVRLPREFRFSGKEVWIAREGDRVVLMPADRSLDEHFRAVAQAAPCGFAGSRRQPRRAEARDFPWP